MLFALLNTTLCASFHSHEDYSRPNLVTFTNDYGRILRVDLNATDEELFKTIREHQVKECDQIQHFNLDKLKMILDNNVSYAYSRVISRKLKELISEQQEKFQAIHDFFQRTIVINFAAYINNLGQFGRQLSSMGIYIGHWNGVYEKIEREFKTRNKENPLLQLFYKLGKHYITYTENEELDKFVQSASRFYFLEDYIKEERNK